MTGHFRRERFKELQVTVPSGQLAFFVWALGGYDNLCTVQVVPKGKGKVLLQFAENIESEVLQVIDCLISEMNENVPVCGGEVS